MLRQPVVIHDPLSAFVVAFRSVLALLFSACLLPACRVPLWCSSSTPCSSFHFRDETLSGSELTAKLEPAFLSGLRCAQPLIRAKFFEVFDNSMKRRVYERLLYVTCSQNWEAMGNHFWIKQCIEVGRAQLAVAGRALKQEASTLSEMK